MPGVKDVSLELIELVSLALTACRSCKAFCSFDFTLEQSNDETLGGFFAIGKLCNPGHWACVDSGGIVLVVLAVLLSVGWLKL
jgi:hypothetical protein